MTIAENADLVLRALAEAPRDQLGRAAMNGQQIHDATQLSSQDVNDAIAILEESGIIELHNWMGTAPYMFGEAYITPRGRFEYEHALAAAAEPERHIPSTTQTTPVGSPYGFSDEDWEYLAEQRSRQDTLLVVMGYKFRSDHNNPERLVENMHRSFLDAVAAYTELPRAIPVALDFRPLAAGYGEHLFNEIARDIIAADIAVFEVSDLNPNVMIELGVALTWGVRVLPIKHQSQPRPPSDISGQTWVDYVEDASAFADPDHATKLLRMVERAARKKARGA